MTSRLPLQSKAFRPKFENKRAVFGGDDEDEEQTHYDELVVGIEDNKVKEAAPKKKAAPLKISALPNADWRANAKHKKELYVPARAQQPTNGQMSTAPEVLTQNESSFGLQITKRTATRTQDHEGMETVTMETGTVTHNQVDNNEPEITKTLEERAVEALIKESMGEGEDEDTGPKKVIEQNDALSFKDDVKTRPDETTMEDYEKIPVEEFGAALLRGLGWSEGQGIGRNRKSAPAPPPAPVKQRDALLGLGAKPEQVEKDQKSKYKRAAYEYKDSSLFKKISKKKYEEENSDSRGSRDRSSSRHSSGSSRHGSSSRHSSSSSRHRSRSRDSSRHSSSSRRRSRSRDDSRHSNSSHRSRRDRSPSPEAKRHRRD